jgi:5-formyltetrahydrofolate cyclo-ligase
MRGSSQELRERKRALRESMLVARAALSERAVAQKSAVIQGRLLGLDEFRHARLVHCYVGVKAGEVRTDRILAETLRSGRRLALPRIEGDRLIHHEIRSTEELVPARFGLYEPPSSAPRIDPAEIDLVVVPGLAFDRAGNRLGFGKGYYDRFLGEARAGKVALLYAVQLLDEVPADEHDVPVDMLVTEKGAERCGPPPAA